MEVTFTVVKWEEKPVPSATDSFPLHRAEVEYQLAGALQGKAYVEYLLFYIEKNGENPHLATSKIAGFLHFEGTYQGKTGSFTASEQGLFAKGTLDSPGTIVKATGELEALTGTYHYQFDGPVSKLILNFHI